MFLDYLLAAKPKPVWEWPQNKKHIAIAFSDHKDKRRASLVDAAQLWASQRQTYPGWVVCPGHIREILRSETVTLLYSVQREIEQLSPSDRGNVVFELLWRADKFFIPLPKESIESCRKAFLDEQNWANREFRRFVGSVLLRTAREERNLALFDEIDAFFDKHLPPDQATATCIAERTRAKEPQFEAGVYRDNSWTLRFGSWSPQDAIYDVARIVDVAGAPARADHFLVMSSRLEHAEALARSQYEDEADYLRLLRVVQAGSENLLKEAFGRIEIARLTEENFALLRRVLNRALEYALEQIRTRKGFSDDFWSKRAAIYVELLSRLSVRINETEALPLFKSSLQLADDPRWRVRELLEPLGHPAPIVRS